MLFIFLLLFFSKMSIDLQEHYWRTGKSRKGMHDSSPSDKKRVIQTRAVGNTARRRRRAVRRVQHGRRNS